MIDNKILVTVFILAAIGVMIFGGLWIHSLIKILHKLLDFDRPDPIDDNGHEVQAQVNNKDEK